MSRTDVLRAEDSYAAFTAGDLDRLLANIDPDIQWSPAGDLADRQVFHGKDEVRDHLERLRDLWDDLRFEPLEIVEAGDKLVAAFRQSGRGRESGVPVEATGVHVWTLRDDLAARLDSYRSFEEGLAAAGVEGDEAVLRRGYAAWNRDDMETVLRLAQPDIEWRPIFGTAGVGSTLYVGEEGLRQFRHELLETLEWFWSEPLAYREGTRAALMTTRANGKGRESGVEVTQEAFHVWNLRDGRVAGMTAHSELAAAEREAGL